LYLFFTREDNTSWGGGKRYDVNITTNDKEFKEYIIDLSTCEHWKGTITQLRLDPVNSADGSVEIVADFYIDSIEFLKELP